MEDRDKKLYPFKFVDKGLKTSWGEVTYKLADLGFVDSMVADGWFGGNTLSEMMGTYMERVVGDDAFEYYGLQFPLMVKVIKTSSWQPLQVNAGDKDAEERYDSYGKKALWYVQEASDEARAILGLNRDIEAGEFYSRCVEGSVREVLNEILPKAGESFIIEPGTVFAAGPGLTILEISECSELTFNIHNWGEDLPDSEQLLLEEAFDLINFTGSPAATVRLDPPDCVATSATVATLGHVRGGTAGEAGGGVREADVERSGNAAGGTTEVVAECEEFKVTRMEIRDPLRVYSEEPGCFAVYHCLSGEAAVQPGPESGGFSQVAFKAGQTVLVPSEINDYLLLPSRSGTILFEALVERRLSPDSYTGSTGTDESDPHIRNWN